MFIMITVHKLPIDKENLVSLWTYFYQIITIFSTVQKLGPVSQRFMINRTIEINTSSMANRVLRKLVINRKPL